MTRLSRDAESIPALGRLAGTAAKHVVLILAGLMALVPTVYMLITAFKSNEEYATDKIGLPHGLVLDHFRSALVDSPFLLWMANSLILVVGSVALSTAIACLASYAIARIPFRGRNLLLGISTALMAIPPVVMITPLFVLYTRLGLMNSYVGVIIVYAGLITPFSVYLLTTFFRTIPNELLEAARIDGARDMAILLRIVLPLSLPALVSLVIVNALFVWNDLLVSIIFLQDDSRRTLMAGLSVFQGRYNNQVPLTMAGMAIASFPMLALYLTFQRHFIKGFMAGALK